MKDLDLSDAIEAVRKFNRFYTKQIGVINDRFLESPFSLAEGRAIREIAIRGTALAADIRNELGLDRGNLSRMLAKFEKLGLVERQPSASDGRQSLYSLTEKGRDDFGKLDQMTRDQIGTLLSDLTAADQRKLLESMATIETMLGTMEPPSERTILMRQPQPGDLGWVVQSNGRLYVDEHGWDETYEGLVAQIVADFVKNFDPKRERCWIVEENGENIGSVFLVKETDEIARLRLLIVEPKARGLGLGKRLVDQCTRFAKQSGYKKITLWTQSKLLAARKIYKEAGYVLVKSEANHMFGQDLVSETWDLEL